MWSTLIFWSSRLFNRCKKIIERTVTSPMRTGSINFCYFVKLINWKLLTVCRGKRMNIYNRVLRCSNKENWQCKAHRTCCLSTAWRIRFTSRINIKREWYITEDRLHIWILSIGDDLQFSNFVYFGFIIEEEYSRKAKKFHKHASRLTWDQSVQFSKTTYRASSRAWRSYERERHPLATYLTRRARETRPKLAETESGSGVNRARKRRGGTRMEEAEERVARKHARVTEARVRVRER